MANEIMNPETGELTALQGLGAGPGGSLAVQLAQAELNQAVTTAKAFPRSIAKAVKNILDLATLDEESAAECVYALPRAGKPIRGPSVRLAEIIASQYGNCHVGARVVAVDAFDKVVIAEGVFFDLETGMKRTHQVRRRISDKNGRLFSEDMITVAGNAAASIAMREAVLKGVPKAIWRKAFEACERVIAGDVKTLTSRREDAIKAFAVWGVKPEQIFASLEIDGLDDIGLDEIATLTSMYRAIKNGEQQVEDYFPAKADQSKAAEAAKGTAAKLGKIADEAKSKATEEKPKDAPQPAEATRVADEGKTADGAPNPADAGSNDAVGDGQAEDGEADDASSFTAAQIDAAFDRGAEAKKAGRSRKATPPEWREPGFEPLLNAWLDGFDRTQA